MAPDVGNLVIPGVDNLATVAVFIRLLTPSVRCACVNYKRQHMLNIIRHPGIRVKHCSCGHSVATMLNPRGVTTVSRKYSLTQDMQMW
jgi:hypothetical protein